MRSEQSARLRRPASAFTPIACLAALTMAGCSLTTEAHMLRELRKLGFSSGEAKCVTRGARAYLSPDQLWSIRSALLTSERPERFADLEGLFQWLHDRIEPEPLSVLTHYALHCRRSSWSRGR
jgi:hypothetical protein